MAILKDIGKHIGNLFEVEPKIEDESLETRINKALSEERERICPSKEEINEFSWITGDNNPIHRISKKARKLGFKDTPLMGSHIASFGEQYIEKVVEKMREYWGADIKIIGQDNSFKAPVYPEQKIFWQVIGYKKINEEIRLEITGRSKEETITDITAHLGKEYKRMPQIAGPIFSAKYLIEQEHLEEFYNCVGENTGHKIPKMLAASFIPATLLELLKERTQTMEGTNLSMNFDFITDPSKGGLQVDLFPARQPKQKGEEYLYKFKAICSQNTKPVIYGEILSSTRKLVEF